jgi:predicted NAD-dependent protein-ADP-ribosyltransferase YbiA (DUF1768 family)
VFFIFTEKKRIHQKMVAFQENYGIIAMLSKQRPAIARITGNNNAKGKRRKHEKNLHVVMRDDRLVCLRMHV